MSDYSTEPINTQIYAGGYMNPEQRPVSPDNPAGYSPVQHKGLWRNLALGSERDEIRAVLDRYYALQGETAGADYDDLPPEILALQDKLRQIDAMEELAEQVKQYRKALKTPGLSMEDRAYLELWLKTNSPAPAPPDPKPEPIEPTMPMHFPANAKRPAFFQITIPGQTTDGLQIFTDATLGGLCSKLALAQAHSTRKIRTLTQEMKSR